jgi:hypothetical protein
LLDRQGTLPNLPDAALLIPSSFLNINFVMTGKPFYEYFSLELKPTILHCSHEETEAGD